MIISRTPLRVSFCGGGTDMPAFYNSAGSGAVVATAINKYIYINVNRKFDKKVRASYSITEIVERGSDLKHDLIREALDLVGITGGVEITSIADIPSQGTGLGSSSCFSVGLLNALYAYTNRRAGQARLAEEACQIEIERLGKPIGKQDQYASAYGGLRYYEFKPDGSVAVEPILCEPRVIETLQSRLMMFYTGMVRSADDILREQSELTTTQSDKRLVLQRMKSQADQLRDSLTDNNLDAFGELLNDGWQLKRNLAPGISTTKIDEWYSLARNHGAIGGKLLGAGGGGFLLFYAYPEHHDLIRSCLPEMRYTPFRFESQGSTIVYVEENGLS